MHLSAQELLDCDRFFDRGCAGGNPLFAFGYIVINGLSSEADYPYTMERIDLSNGDSIRHVCERRVEVSGVCVCVCVCV